MVQRGSILAVLVLSWKPLMVKHLLVRQIGFYGVRKADTRYNNVLASMLHKQET